MRLLIGEIDSTHPCNHSEQPPAAMSMSRLLLNGSLLEPKISIDIAKLILATQKEKIDQKKEELKDELLGKLLGSDKDDKEKAVDTNQSKTGADDGEAAPELTEKQKKRIFQSESIWMTLNS